MIEDLVGSYAEIRRRSALIKVREVDYPIEIPPSATPLDGGGFIAFTRPFNVRFGVLLTVNNEIVVLRLSEENKLDDFNDIMSNKNPFVEAFSVVNLQLAVLDLENEERLIIVPEENTELTPYIDAVEELQKSALERVGRVYQKFDVEHVIARTSKLFKDVLMDVTIEDETIGESTVEAIVLPNPKRNEVNIVLPIDVRLDVDEVSFVCLEPLKNPVFISRWNGLEFIRKDIMSERISGVHGLTSGR